MHRVRSLKAPGRRVVGLLLAAAVVALGAPQASAQAVGPPITLELPRPTGPFPIARTDLHLIDPARPDPWVADRPRELMVSVWYPARRPGGPAAPYMPPGAAAHFARVLVKPAGLDPARVDLSALTTHAAADAPAEVRRGPFPVVLYSPGGNLPRALGTALVEDLASRGYVVVTLDHTHEAGAVEFPDGRIAPRRASGGDDPLRRMLEGRVADTRFVLGQLARIGQGRSPDAPGKPLPAGLRRALDLDRLGMFGHSAGGFAALESMGRDPRIDAAANLDGSMAFSFSKRVFGPVVEAGLTRPFLLMGGGVSGPQRKPHTHEWAPDWKRLWETSTGWKRDIHFPGAEHLSFADHQALAPQIAAQAKLPPLLVTGALGTAEPARVLAAERAYLAAFFDLHLKGEPQPLLDGPSPEHPDATFVP